MTLMHHDIPVINTLTFNNQAKC